MHRVRLLLLALTLPTSAALATSPNQPAPNTAQPAILRVYVGTYTGAGPDDSRGIYVLELDTANGQLSAPRLAAETTNPSFLTLTPDGQRLYSVTETRQAEGRSGAALVAWQIESDGSLSEIGRAPSGGDGPCFVGLSPDLQHAGVANYGGGSVALFQLDSQGTPTRTSLMQHEGSSINANRQQSPHAHSFQFTADGKYAFSPDLGTDELVAYRIQDHKLVRDARLTYALPAGHGPRHFAIAPDGKFVLVIEELSSVITVLKRRGDHFEMVAEYATLPDGFEDANTTAEIQFHPNGRFVYGSNRGHDSLAIFQYDAVSGRLTSRGNVPTGGKTPRNFRLSPDGKWLIAANQNSNQLAVFRIGEDGIPVATPHTVNIPKPVCIKFSNPAPQP